MCKEGVAAGQYCGRWRSGLGPSTWIKASDNAPGPRLAQCTHDGEAAFDENGILTSARSVGLPTNLPHGAMLDCEDAEGPPLVPGISDAMHDGDLESDGQVQVLVHSIVPES